MATPSARDSSSPVATPLAHASSPESSSGGALHNPRHRGSAPSVRTRGKVVRTRGKAVRTRGKVVPSVRLRLARDSSPTAAAPSSPDSSPGLSRSSLTRPNNSPFLKRDRPSSSRKPEGVASDALSSRNGDGGKTVYVAGTKCALLSFERIKGLLGRADPLALGSTGVCVCPGLLFLSLS